jgi:hypothetical protein
MTTEVGTSLKAIYKDFCRKFNKLERTLVTVKVIGLSPNLTLLTHHSTRGSAQHLCAKV